MDVFDRVKLRLDGAGDDKDELIYELIETVKERMRVRFFAGREVPEALDYVVTEVTVARFNRIASEGMSSQTVEGESISFADIDDFAPFLTDIATYQRENESSGKGRMRFL